jgi:5'-3' exonuclease
VSDLIQYCVPEIFNPKFDVSEPYAPFEQLLMVTPVQCCGLLPFSYMAFISESNDEFEDYFPKSFELDVVKGQKNIYSEPILPHINVDLIKKIVYSLPLSEPEIARNIIKTRPFCHKL